MQTSFGVPVIIADHGELQEVRQVLESLDIQYVQASPDAELHGTLLVSNASRACTRGSRSANSGRCFGRFHIVVAEKISKTMRRELERIRPDFLLQRPVDPASLRLLVLHALYGGPERRRSERVVLSAVVKYRTRLRTRRATLVDLSEHGCRLTSARELLCGETLTLALPRELTGSDALRVEGRVVAAEPCDELGRHAASISFGRLDVGTRRVLRAVMAGHAVGAAPMRPHQGRSESQRPARAAPSPLPAAGAPAVEPDRRSSPRVVFERSVLAAGRFGAQVLIGRDLSHGGMRVAPDPDLSVGDEFNLVIHGSGGRRSVVVRAVVTRDDGDAGCVLRFDDVPEDRHEAIDAIVRALPEIPGRAMNPALQPNVVVSEVVTRS